MVLELGGNQEEKNMEIKYDKLVRDKIPEIINNSGRICATRILSSSERLTYLFKKIREEIDELDKNNSVEELADIQEVLDQMAIELNIKKQDIKTTQEKKRKSRGGFEKGIVLLCVSDNK